jgi:hypothetical protein
MHLMLGPSTAYLDSEMWAFAPCELLSVRRSQTPDQSYRGPTLK